MDRFYTILFENANLDTPHEARAKELRRIVADHFMDLLDEEKDDKLLRAAQDEILHDMSDQEYVQEWERKFYEEL